MCQTMARKKLRPNSKRKQSNRSISIWGEDTGSPSSACCSNLRRFPGENAEYVHQMALQMLQAALRVYEDASKEGLIDKKKDKAEVAVETAVSLLQIQVELGNAEDNDKFNDRLIDPYSRGYVFGLCDALLQSAGVSDDVEAMALLTVVHIKLFGEEGGATIVGQSFKDQENELFSKGRMRGGQELNRVL